MPKQGRNAPRRQRTEEEKKRIVSEAITFGSITKAAELNNISERAVYNYLSQYKDFAEECKAKKSEATILQSVSLMTYMERQTDTVKQIIDEYLKALLLPEKIKAATPSQLSTVIGTLVDKYIMISDHQKAMPKEDDALTKSLKEEAERMNHAIR